MQSGMQLPSQQLQLPSQAYQQQPQTISQFAPPAQQTSQQTRQHTMAAPIQTITAAPTQTGLGMQQGPPYGGHQSPPPGASTMSLASPNVQYIQLADGTIRAMVPVQGEVPRSAQIEGVTTEPQKAPALHPAPVQTSAQVFPSTLNSTPSEFPSQYSNVAAREQPAEYAQMMAPQEMRTSTLPEPALALEPVVSGRDMPLEGSPVPDQMGLPASATETLYVEDVPTDMTKRELSHIFRPFGGFKVRAYNSTAICYSCKQALFSVSRRPPCVEQVTPFPAATGSVSSGDGLGWASFGAACNILACACRKCELSARPRKIKPSALHSRSLKLQSALRRRCHACMGTSSTLTPPSSASCT